MMLARRVSLLAVVVAAVPLRKRRATLFTEPNVTALSRSAHKETNGTLTGAFSAAARAELRTLLRTLIGGRTQPAAEFVPKCTAHVKQLVRDLDASYTDAQLERNLLNECQMAKEFPETRKSGFHSHEACQDFAKKLADARMQELKSGDQGQYQKFCEDYHAHLKEGPQPAPAKEGPQSQPQPAPASNSNREEELRAKVQSAEVKEREAQKNKAAEQNSAARVVGLPAVALLATTVCVA